MRLFRMSDDDKLVEYQEQDFTNAHSESLLESWLESNPDCIIGHEKLLVLGRQITTNLGSFIDLLALDRDGNVAVLELKRGRTPREVIAQVLEYASYAATLSYEQLESILRNYVSDENASLSEYHRNYFDLTEAVSFNKDQRVVIVGQDISPGIRQTALFLQQRGIRFTCVEFTYFRTPAGERLLSIDPVVGGEPRRPPPAPAVRLPPTNKEKFLRSCDENGRPILEALLALSGTHGFPIHWGAKGFSLNVDLGGTHVAFCRGYPPSSVYHQSIYTAFYYIMRKVQDAGSLIAICRAKLEQTGLFVPAGAAGEMKYLIQQLIAKERIEQLVAVFLALAQGIQARGLIESDNTEK